MKTFALVAILCLALASAFPYYNNYNNYMGMGQYYNNPYQYGGMSRYSNYLGGGLMGYDRYRSPYSGYMNYNNYGNYGGYNDYRYGGGRRY